MELEDLSSDATHAPVLKRLRALLEDERVSQNDGNTPYPTTDKQGKDFWNTYDAAPSVN